MDHKRYRIIYISGGIILTVILGLVLLPFFAIKLWPFNNNEITYDFITYRSTETLHFDENYSGFEYLRVGDEISYSVHSNPTPISFSIWDQPFEKLPTKTIHRGDYFQTSIGSNEYHFYSLFLRPGSSIFYNFTVFSGGPIEFFITNGSDLYGWNQGGDPNFYYHINNTLAEFGNFSNIYKSQDYFLVWNNENLTNSTVNCVINYTATNVYDFSVVDVAYEKVFLVPQVNFTVPFGRSGNWFFFIYYDPLFSLEPSTTITYSIIYKIREN